MPQNRFYWSRPCHEKSTCWNFAEKTWPVHLALDAKCHQALRQFNEGWISHFDYEVHVWLWRRRKFEERWRTLLETIKEKWESCYMKIVFTLGMRSTQLSESVNADIKSFMSVDLDIIKKFKRLEVVWEEKRYNDLKSEYEARQKNSKTQELIF